MAAKGGAMTDTITSHFGLTKDDMAEGIARASGVLLRPWQRRASGCVLVVIDLFVGAAFILPTRSLADPKTTFGQLQAWHGAAA